MQEMLIVIAFVVVWFLATKYLFPKMGVPG